MITSLENPFAQLAALVAGAALAFILAPLWLLLQALKACARHWRPVALALAILGAGALCVACPLLPVGLAIVAGYGWATMPRVKAATA